MSADSTTSAGSVLDTWRQWYHLPALALVALFMFWVRVLPYDNFVSSDRVRFRGNDAYYHFRTTMYSVENWPRTSYMDPWTHFPYGTTVGQFGTLFDLVVATVALLVGMGSPTEHQVGVIAVLTPAVIGTLCVIPVFYIARRLTGSRIAGLFGAFVFAIVPNSIWLNRSTVGFFGHHVAENLLMATTILALLVAVSVVQREKPVYEQVQDRDWAGLKPSVKWSAAVGVVYALYVWTWPPGVIVAGIIGTYFLVAILLEVIRGNSPEHLAFAGAISMGVGGLLSILLIRTLEFGTTDPSLTQVFVPLVVAAGCVFLAWLARQWEHQDLEAWKFPVTVGAVGAVGVLGVYFLLPSAFSTIWSNVQRTLFLGQGVGTLTISEAQPMELSNLGEEFFSEYGYGFTFLTALLALLWLGVQSYTRSDRWEQYLVVVVWSVFLTLMAITQIRFHYYLVSVVAILNAYLFWLVYKGADFPSITSTRDIAVVVGTAAFAFGFPIVASIRDIELTQRQYFAVAGGLLLVAAVLIAIDYYDDIDVDLDLDAVESYHLLIVVLIAVVVVVPVASPVAVGATATDITENQVPGEVELWEGSNDWLADNTPEVGDYGGAGNADELDYYGTYDATDDFAYPEGAYGVMSWWDYGHWITVDGERIPHANPFQQGPRSAAEFLLTQDEQRAELVVDALPGESSPQEYSNEELQGIVDGLDEQQANEEMRYVMIDHQMAGGKFPAITEWTDPQDSPDAQYFEQEQRNLDDDPETTDLVTVRSEDYYDTMLSRLYLDDARGLEHYRLVHETEDVSGIASVAQRTEDGNWETVVVNRDFGSIQQLFGAPLAQIQNSPNFTLYDIQQASAVKTFERVEGATIEGETAPNSTVFVSVELETNAPDLGQEVEEGEDQPNRTFTYTQQAQADEDGSFAITVPYATDDELGTEDGYTDAAVEATDEYTVQSAGEDDQPLIGTVSVPESAVVNGETVEVTLEEPDIDDGEGDGGDDEDTGEEGTDDGDDEDAGEEGTDDGE